MKLRLAFLGVLSLFALGACGGEEAPAADNAVDQAEDAANDAAEAAADHADDGHDH